MIIFDLHKVNSSVNDELMETVVNYLLEIDDGRKGQTIYFVDLEVKLLISTFTPPIP